MLEQRHTYIHPFNGRPIFQDNMGKPAPERLNQSDFNKAIDDGVTVTYANHLHLTRQIITPAPHLIIQISYRPTLMLFLTRDAQPTVSKHCWNRAIVSVRAGADRM